ncbi:MAG: heme ABC transporter ATP-binding protein [Anaerolineales bacterium]
MIAIHNISAAYGSNTVLQNVELSLARGEVLGLIGPNGSGKTSLIRVLSNSLHPSAGSVDLDGRDISAFSSTERARLIAVVPQSAHLPPALTVWECVSLGRTPHLNWLGKLGPRDEAQVEYALKASETLALKDRRVGELSGGEQQRVLLARALAQDCPILLLDEPTAHLDLHHQVALLNLVQRMAKEQNLAVLIALHDLNLAALYADRVALLVEGLILASGTPREVLTTEVLRSAYQVPLQVHPSPEQGLPWVVLQRS